MNLTSHFQSLAEYFPSLLLTKTMYEHSLRFTIRVNQMSRGLRHIGGRVTG